MEILKEQINFQIDKLREALAKEPSDAVQVAIQNQITAYNNVLHMICLREKEDDKYVGSYQEIPLTPPEDKNAFYDVTCKNPRTKQYEPCIARFENGHWLQYPNEALLDDYVVAWRKIKVYIPRKNYGTCKTEFISSRDFLRNLKDNKYDAPLYAVVFKVEDNDLFLIHTFDKAAPIGDEFVVNTMNMEINPDNYNTILLPKVIQSEKERQGGDVSYEYTSALDVMNRLQNSNATFAESDELSVLRFLRYAKDGLYCFGIKK